MKERSTLARPYAVAVFKLAAERGALDAWSESLAFLAAVARDPLMQGLMANPKLDRARLAELVIEVAGDRLTDEGENLVRLLAEKHRLAVAPEIAQVYEIEREKAQRRARVEVATAYPLTEDYEARIAEAMQRRLGCQVDMETRVDPALISGVVIRAGDQVIDASLKGRLERLAAVLA